MPYNYHNRTNEMVRSRIRAYLEDNPTYNKLLAIKKLIEHNESTFFAKDLSISSAMIFSLNGCLITSTGNKIYDFVCIDEREQLYKKYEITEWKLCVPIDILIEEYNRVIEKLSL